jgi:hypothetical protein
MNSLLALIVAGRRFGCILPESCWFPVDRRHKLPKTFRVESAGNDESIQELAEGCAGVERKMLPNFGKRA